MSQAIVPASAQTKSSSTTFSNIEHRLHDVYDKILPRQPYLLTIPSDRPYRTYGPDPSRWWLTTPFDSDEGQLQYMSLLTHQDADESLLKVDGSRIDEHGQLLSNMPSPRSDIPSRPETPVSAAPKKKISLKDYKSKDRSAVHTPERPQSSSDMRKQAIKSHKEEANSSNSSNTTTTNNNNSGGAGGMMRKAELASQPPHSREKTEHKALGLGIRRASPLHPTSSSSSSSQQPSVANRRAEQKPALTKATREDVESQRPIKKRRMSEDNATSTTKSTPAAAATTNRRKPDPIRREPLEKRHLPDLLSPEMPAATATATATAQKKSKSRALPTLLSPKLPPTLEKAASHPPRSDDSRNFMRALDSPLRFNEKKKDDSVTNRQRSESQLSARPSTPAAKATSPAPKTLMHPTKPDPDSSVAQTASPRPRQRHIVRLKYGKKNRKRVEALLNFSTRPRKDTPVKPEPDRLPSTKQPVQADPPPTARKRPAETRPEEPVKKPKLAETNTKADRPSTPKVDLAGTSPSAQHKGKSTFTTPRKNSTSSHLKPPAMQRIASTDTTEAHTPQESGRMSTPQASNYHSSHPKTSPIASTHRPRTEDAAAWIEMQSRIFQLGRTLKKEGSKLAAEEVEKQKKLGVVLLIEALVCFILNTAIQAHARPNTDPGWSTIIPYHTMVYKQSRPYDHLRGVVIQLGAVVRQQLQQELIKRLSKETLLDDPISAPTPGSDGTTRNGEDSSRRQKSFIELRDELVQNSKDLKIAWLESSRQVTLKIIEDQYPKTWRNRLVDASKRNPEISSPKDLRKTYFLPLDVSTTCFEASIYALTFLEDWTMYAGVAWKSRVDL